MITAIAKSQRAVFMGPRLRGDDWTSLSTLHRYPKSLM